MRLKTGESPEKRRWGLQKRVVEKNLARQTSIIEITVAGAPLKHAWSEQYPDDLFTKR